jgi:hypothetical protein
MLLDKALLMGYCEIVEKRGNLMIRAKQPVTEMVIDLTGPDGNAYVLLGYASRFSKQLGLESETVLSEMKSGDYENLIEVFDRYFGDFVILER